MIKNIYVTGVSVSDQERALDFYTNKLGFEKRADISVGDYRWIEVVPPGAETALVLEPAQAPVRAPLVALEDESALLCPNQDKHTSTHLPLPPDPALISASRPISEADSPTQVRCTRTKVLPSGSTNCACMPPQDCLLGSSVKCTPRPRSCS